MRRMKTSVFRTTAIVLLAAVSSISVAQKSDPPELIRLESAGVRYFECISDYLDSRLKWKATPSEMADAALSACSDQRREIEAAAAAIPRKSATEVREFAARAEERARRLAIEIMVEAQNNPKFSSEASGKK